MAMSEKFLTFEKKKEQKILYSIYSMTSLLWKILCNVNIFVVRFRLQISK